MSQIDDEFAAKRGSTASEESMTEEADPENRAQDPGQVREKLKAETRKEGGGVGGAVKAVLHHVDRELAGEYERREDPDAPANPQASMPEQQPPAEPRR